MPKIIQKIKDNKIEAVFVTIVVVIFIILMIDTSPKEEEDISEEKEVETEEVSEKVVVDIKGAVNNPGVFEMESDERVIDVIEKAGGLTADADTSLINLSKKVTDEMVITIYTQAEIQEMEEECPPCECPEINDACVTEETISDNQVESTEKNTSTGKISINTATSEQLQTLDGIGEARAEAIIGYRETNGAFKSIEEIKNVSGIGDTIYEKIKDDITV